MLLLYAAVCYCVLLCCVLCAAVCSLCGCSYKQDLTVEEKELLKELLKKQQHPQITPEIRYVISSALCADHNCNLVMIADNLFYHLKLSGDTDLNGDTHLVCYCSRELFFSRSRGEVAPVATEDTDMEMVV